MWLSIALADEDSGASAKPSEPLTRNVQLPGARADVRERSTTVAMHMLRRVLSAS